jgi:hypothetical protein
MSTKHSVIIGLALPKELFFEILGRFSSKIITVIPAKLHLWTACLPYKPGGSAKTPC